MGRLLFRSVEGNGSWSAQIDRRESEPAEVSPEIIDSVRDWYQALCRHTFLRRAADDASYVVPTGTIPIFCSLMVKGSRIWETLAFFDPIQREPTPSDAFDQLSNLVPSTFHLAWRRSKLGQSR